MARNRLELILQAQDDRFRTILRGVEAEHRARLLENVFDGDERRRRLEAYRAKLRRLLDEQDRLDGEALRSARRLVTDLQDRLLGRMARAISDAERGMPWGVAWLDRLEREVRQAVVEFAGYYAVDLGPWMERSARNGVATVNAALAAVSLPEFVGVTRQTIRTAASWSADLITGLGTRAIDKISDEVRVSLTTGEAPQRLMERLKPTLRAQDSPFRDVAYRAEIVTRTEIARAQSVATEMRQREVVETYPELGLQRMWVAVHDSRLCPECEALDGNVFEVKDPTAPDQPLHPNCRCVWVSHVPGLSERPKPGQRAETVVAPGGIPSERLRRASVAEE